jgi:hypothetical protein
MSNHMTTTNLTQTLGNEKHNPQDDEIDLLDVIGFFWRFRRIIVSGVVLGFLGSVALWVAKQPAKSTVSANIVWWAQLSPDENGAGLASAPQQLKNFLRTPYGARAFYKGFARGVKNKSLPIEDWAIKQQGDGGLVKDIESTGRTLSIVVESAGYLTEEEIRQALPIAINSAVAAFNDKFAEVQAKITEDNLELQMQMGAIKIKALQLFDLNLNISAASEKTITEAIVRELTRNSGPDTITFLLSAIPDDNVLKRELLSEYKKQFQANEALQAQLRVLTKTLGVESVVPLTTFGTVTELVQGQTMENTAPAPHLQPLLMMIVLGVIIGGFISSIMALALSFWKRNREQLQKLFYEKS